VKYTTIGRFLFISTDMSTFSVLSSQDFYTWES